MAMFTNKNMILNIFWSLKIFLNQILENIFDMLIIQTDIFQDNVNETNLLLKVFKCLLLGQFDMLLRIVIHQIGINAFQDAAEHLNADEY